MNNSPQTETESSVESVKGLRQVGFGLIGMRRCMKLKAIIMCKVIVCKVVDTSEQIPCGKTYIKSSGSTDNAINHLRNHHNITKDGKINKVS